MLILGPHRTHAVRSCGHLLHMSHVAWSFSLLGTHLSCAKWLNWSRCCLGKARVCPINPILDGVQIAHRNGHFCWGTCVRQFYNIGLPPDDCIARCSPAMQRPPQTRAVAAVRDDNSVRWCCRLPNSVDNCSVIFPNIMSKAVFIKCT